MLRGQSLVKSFNGQKIIDDVSVELEAGQIGVIIGPSGAGKSTLLKLLAWLEMPDSGTVAVDDFSHNFPIDKNTKLKPPWPLVTIVFQQLFLWPHLTLKRNIALPLEARQQRVDQDKLQYLIELFDMKSFIDRFPNESSLGQRQRAAIVRALMLEPKYLLLDEITSSLDVEQVAIILDHLKDLASTGIGIITITHSLHFARQAADRIIFMDAGRILESGDRTMLDSPKEDRVRKFLSIIESAS